MLQNLPSATLLIRSIFQGCTWCILAVTKYPESFTFPRSHYAFYIQVWESHTCLSTIWLVPCCFRDKWLKMSEHNLVIVCAHICVAFQSFWLRKKCVLLWINMNIYVVVLYFFNLHHNRITTKWSCLPFQINWKQVFSGQNGTAVTFTSTLPSMFHS